MSEVWYQAGLRFECQQCGRCCTGEPGFVWVTTQEMRLLAERLGLSTSEFRKRYARKVFGRYSLVERSNGDCCLLDEQGRCTVYDLRPVQCRTWPFWPSNIQTPEDWRATCLACPGAGKGRVYTLAEIRKLADELDV